MKTHNKIISDRQVQFGVAEETQSIKPNHTKEDILKFFQDNPKANYEEMYERFGVGSFKFRNELMEEVMVYDCK